MKILAEGDPGVYLVVADEVEPGAYDADDMGRVLDTREGVLYPRLPVDSILVHGGWDGYEGAPIDLDAALDGVEIRDHEPGDPDYDRERDGLP